MLAACHIINDEDAQTIENGLHRIAQEIEDGTFPFSIELEDIHMNIEHRLKELIGEPAGRLHTARSRNDQVATDFKLWVREAIDRLDAYLKQLQAALIEQAEATSDALMPGMTHLQVEQPVTVGHHLLAYVEMIGRDRSRLQGNRQRLNECPLGSAALAGTSFPINRDMTARALGFDRPTANSLDAVSDRDFVLDYLSAAAITATHLSRLAEEIVLWLTPAFGFIQLSDAYTTGSSIMPQKRNPDGAELIRGKTGRVIGALNSLLITMKGLPLAYSKDMQEDKEPLFDAADTIEACTQVMAGMVADIRWNRPALAAASGHGFSTATDLADWLVQHAAIPFRQAHHITGKIVHLAEQQGCALHELSLSDMQEICSSITDDVFAVLSPDASVASRTSVGGTAPAQVRAAITTAKKRYL